MQLFLDHENTVSFKIKNYSAKLTYKVQSGYYLFSNIKMNADLIREIILKPILHLNARELHEFPPEFYENCLHTLEIYLRWNRLHYLPPWINRLLNMTNLYLSSNYLMALPEEISQLENLQVLVIDNNQLTSLPNSIGNLKSLMFLDVSMNSLPSLPQGICELDKLETLLAANNKLELLPEQLGECQALEELSFTNNKIIYLPCSIVHLPFLNYLNLANNNLLYLPAIPFVSDPQINIQSNPNITYGTFQMLYQVFKNNITLHLKENRCSSWQIINDNCSFCIQIETLCSETNLKLILPQGLQYFVSDLTKHYVPSLLELCSRKSYYIYQQLITIMGKSAIARCNLPFNLTNKLRQGPVAQCFEPACKKPIYSEAIGWLIHTNSEEIKHGIVFFCSTHCAIQSLNIFFSN